MTAIRELRSTADLDAALAASDERPLVLLKHSTRCHVSARALQELRGFAQALDAERASVALVHVVEDRALSNEVTRRLGIRHESPQALVISRGRVVWHDSHDGVVQERLAEALEGVGEPAD